MEDKLFNDFVKFAIQHKYSGDIDPVYPVLKNVQKIRGVSKEEAMWHTLLYTTWYHLGSAEIILDEYPTPKHINKNIGYSLRTGVERRGFRGSGGYIKSIEQIDSVLKESCGDIINWVEESVSLKGYEGWNSMYNKFSSIRYNGSWAAYKWCDLMKNVIGYNITAPDIGIGGGGETSSPVQGLVILTGYPTNVIIKNKEIQIEFYNKCLNAGVPFDGLEELETALCDFNSLYRGRYYLGHDLDLQIDNIRMLPEVYWKARDISFPHEFLGEFSGWHTVRKDLKQLYKNTGKLMLEKSKSLFED